MTLETTPATLVAWIEATRKDLVDWVCELLLVWLDFCRSIGIHTFMSGASDVFCLIVVGVGILTCEFLFRMV